MRKSVLVASAFSSLTACCLLLPASTQAQGIYAKAGVLGAGLGYSHSLTDRFSLRTDVTTVGTAKYQRTMNLLHYSARLKANQWGVYGDWFPFANGLRVSGGLHVRQLNAQVQARPAEAGSITLNNISVPYGPGDSVTGRVRFPALAPYLGIGWGHHGTQAAGFGFVFDVGVSFGAPQVDLAVSDLLRAKLSIAAAMNGTTLKKELQAERQKLQDQADKVKIFPHLYVGLSYRF